MATIKDIAKLLVEKHKMSMTIADDFLQNMVEVINEGLLQDRMVKIKGFGTFKLQEVKERASVNVNTGERVVIAAHDKITFTPDAVMKDMVNKPFAHFETVIVDGNETPAPKQKEEQPAKAVEEKPAEVVEEKAEEPVKVEEPKKEEPKKVEEPVKVEEPKKEEPKKVEEPVKAIEPKKEEPKPVKAVEQPAKVEEPQSEADEPASSRKWIYIAAGVICAVVLCLVCYFAQNNNKEAQEAEKTELAKAQQAEAAKKAEAEAQAQAKAQAQQAAAKEEADLERYNKDARVKYGAYYIIGTDTTVTVYKGQTLRGISKAYLGPGMECYVEAYNETKEVKAGDKVRIPKLKAKKRKNKK